MAFVNLVVEILALRVSVLMLSADVLNNVDSFVCLVITS